MDNGVTGLRGMLNAKKAADYVGICYPSFMRKVRKKNTKAHLTRYRMGEHYFFKPEDLDAWIEAHKE